MGTYLAMYLNPARWHVSAPTCLPRPMVIIFMMPLSKGPRNDVCGLMRQLTMMPSASAAFLSINTSMPSALTPIFLTSMDERIGQPMVSSVTP